jgi:guanylate kinase
MNLPELTPQERSAAAARGVAARQLRATVKRELHHGSVALGDVLDQAQADDDRGRALARMKVADLLAAFPRIGPVRASALMDRLGIAANRRVGGLGPHQMRALVAELGAARSQAMLMVLSGPSGVGKGTVVAELRRLRPDVWVSVSATTRAPRPGEVEGEEYLFWSQERFARTIAQDGFLEWAQFAGNRYGTPREPVERHRAAGHSVLLEIELQGARQVRDAVPEACLVFLTPPSTMALEDRLRGRGTESEADVQARLERARHELSAAPEFDSIVINDDVGRAAAALVDLLPPGDPVASA